LDGPSLRKAGTLLFLGTAQFAFFFILAEIYYPGYNVSTNYISDLGATCRSGTCNFYQPSSAIFNSSIVLLGLFLLSGSYFLWKGYGSKALSFFVVLAGVGAVGVGTFNESYGSIHAYFSALTFISIGIQALLVSKVAKSPMSYFSAATGVITLGATVLFLGGDYFGIGAGGMERMIVYPVLLVGIAFGGYLMGIASDEMR